MATIPTTTKGNRLHYTLDTENIRFSRTRSQIVVIKNVKSVEAARKTLARKANVSKAVYTDKNGNPHLLKLC